ncbi:hypothetical protein KXD97_31740 (plasmid) [Mycobacterium sp. SMC-8]|uniref:hypothetical protein n=1 Tax=unclassified Mycobacterium TaxID=2642494 RepID=UPI0021B16B12|nr:MULTISPECIES: hypothetical protein [unclassified Mycobacterium]UXA15733.1 hypothetical protein KXD97_31740 [Mycobacterium sp. SMC-8]UXA21165.1 hypothetical protein KXD98_26740 [Mycobacterium sp. SMC-4]
MMVMTDSVAMGGAMVYPIAAFLVALAAIGLLSLLFVVLLALVVRRLCRRTDRFAAARWSDSSVNTVGGGFSSVGGSALWPAALVYQVPEPERAQRPGPRVSRRGQRRQLSSRSASTLQHGERGR